MAKHVVISGSTSGLGRATARACLELGARVVVSSEDEAALADTLAEFSGFGDRVAGTVCDITSTEQVEQLVAFATGRFGDIDCWINNAGTTAPSGEAAAVPLAYGERLTSINIIGTYRASVLAMRQFRRQGRGRLINITGRGEKGPVKEAALYAASKSWTRNFTLAMAAEEKTRGIEVATYNPGFVFTPLTLTPQVLRGKEEQQVKGLRFIMPLIGDPPDKPGTVLARYATRDKPVATELRHRRILPHVLGRLLTGRRAEVDLDSIAPRVVDPEGA